MSAARRNRAQGRASTLYLGPQFNGPEPNYLRTLAAIPAGAITPGVVNHAFIYHDDWCAIFTGGACNCDPEVKVVAPVAAS